MVVRMGITVRPGATRAWRRGCFAAAMITCFAVLSSCASGHVTVFNHEPVIVRDCDALLADVTAAVESSPRLSRASLGTVTYGSFEQPMVVVHFEPTADDDRVPNDPVPAVLIIGGVHGNEPAGAAWAIDLIQQLAGNPEWRPGVRIDVIPVVNIWGWAHDIRYNADGRDINRDFASFNTQEARLVRAFLSDRRYDLVIDDHEDPDATGFYLYQYGQKDEELSREVIAAIRAAGYPIEQDVNMIILSTDDGLIDAPMWGLRYMRLTGQLSITNYIRLARNRYVYTVETPTALPLEARIAAHRQAFEILSSRSVGLRPPEEQ